MSRHAGRWKEGMDARCKNGFYVAELVSPNLSHPFSVLDFGSIARPFACPHSPTTNFSTAVMEIVLAIQGKDYVLTYTSFRP
jgi:hypothetical protein